MPEKFYQRRSDFLRGDAESIKKEVESSKYHIPCLGKYELCVDRHPDQLYYRYQSTQGREECSGDSVILD